MMRPINYLVVHCTATPQSAKVESIQNYWKQAMGWKSPGYHFIVKPDGSYVNLQPIEKASNGVAGHNANSIHISYIGGVDGKNMPLDNRTAAQKATILKLLQDLKKQFPKAVIQGHRDFQGVHKACPSFDAKKEYQSL